MGNQDNIQSIQLETTSRCNLNCITCLKPVYGDNWIERDMNDSLFSQIIDQIPKKTALHLQGWGEPLLHPQTLSHIELVKRSGHTVSFTTNGTIMSIDLARLLINSGLDGITFSMAGLSAETQDRLRGPGTLVKLQKSIEIFSQMKIALQSETINIAASYLLTPQTMKDLPAAISWCRKRGINQFVTVHLTQASCQKQSDLQFMLPSDNSVRSRLLRINCQLRALPGNMRLTLKKFAPTLTPVCDKNPTSSLFIGSSGEVSPCVFLCPPTKKNIDWRYNGRRYSQPPLVFGNIATESLAVIWNKPEYRSFRNTYRKRLDYYDHLLSTIDCSLAGSARLEAAVKDISNYFESYPVPEPCSCCAKSDGY